MPVGSELLPVQSWEDISRDCLQAARLLRDKHPRSSISRAYYAAFSAAVWLWWRQHGRPVAGLRETPRHGEMPKLLEQLLLKQGKKISRDCRRGMLLLYNDRLTADYQTQRGKTCDPNDAGNALRRAAYIMRSCGVLL